MLCSARFTSIPSPDRYTVPGRQLADLSRQTSSGCSSKGHKYECCVHVLLEDSVFNHCSWNMRLCASMDCRPLGKRLQQAEIHLAARHRSCATIVLELVQSTLLRSNPFVTHHRVCLFQSSNPLKKGILDHVIDSTNSAVFLDTSSHYGLVSRLKRNSP